MTSVKTNKLQIVAIAVLMVTMTSCEWGFINPFKPIFEGWRSEPISMRVTSKGLGLDNELFYRDSIYRQGESENFTKRFVKQEYIDNNGKIDTIEKHQYMLGFYVECCSSSLYDDTEIRICIEIAGYQPWGIGQTYHFNTLDDEFMHSRVHVYRGEHFELVANSFQYNVDGWIRITSHNASDMICHSDFDGEFEMTLTNKDNPNDCILVKNGVFRNAPFHYPNHNMYDSVID